jgi:biopolymer transport protein ExbD
VGQPDHKINPRDIRTVEISNTGYYKLDARQMQLAQIIGQLAQESRANPNLVVYIRADKDCRYDLVAQLFGGCQKYGITRYSLRTDPTPK